MEGGKYQIDSIITSLETPSLYGMTLGRSSLLVGWWSEGTIHASESVLTCSVPCSSYSVCHNMIVREALWKLKEDVAFSVCANPGRDNLF